MEVAIFSLITGVVGSLATVLVSKVTASGQSKAKEVEARAPEWSAFLAEVRAENQRNTEQLNGRIDRLQSKVQRLEDKLAEKDKLIEEKDALIARKDRLLHLAMRELARFARKFPNDVVTKSISFELKEEMSAYWPRDEPNV